MVIHSICTSTKKTNTIYIICWALWQSSSLESLTMWWIDSSLPPPHSPPHPWGQRRGVRGERWGCRMSVKEERTWCCRSPYPALQFRLRGEAPPPPPLLHIWLPPEHSFGGKTRMFLFPRREEELWSETTELKHRKASWALTQPAGLWWWGLSLSDAFSFSFPSLFCAPYILYILIYILHQRPTLFLKTHALLLMYWWFSKLEDGGGD